MNGLCRSVNPKNLTFHADISVSAVECYNYYLLDFLINVFMYVCMHVCMYACYKEKHILN